jgi:hypothetical protein
VHTAGVNWMAIARNDTNRWRLLGEEFLRSWEDTMIHRRSNSTVCSYAEAFTWIRWDS